MVFVDLGSEAPCYRFILLANKKVRGGNKRAQKLSLVSYLFRCHMCCFVVCALVMVELVRILHGSATPD